MTLMVTIGTNSTTVSTRITPVCLSLRPPRSPRHSSLLVSEGLKLLLCHRSPPTHTLHSSPPWDECCSHSPSLIYIRSKAIETLLIPRANSELGPLMFKPHNYALLHHSPPEELQTS